MTGGINLIKKMERTITVAQVIFPCLVCQRCIIKSCLIEDNGKHRGICNEEFKSDTDGRMEALQ